MGIGPETQRRICLCVLMNHPFPANLSLLRRIYAGRFSAIRFLIPFERVPDAPDVITVYRGSYTHCAYLTDAQHLLSQIDCDHYIVVHDDVLLNPQLSERTFPDIFPLGASDGFIAFVEPTHEQIGRCVWHFGFIPKLLYPKSQLFGSGIEADTLARYLPDPERLTDVMTKQGIVPTGKTRFKADEITFGNFVHVPSRALLHGLSIGLDPADEAQRRIDELSLQSERMLVQAMLDAQRAGRPDRITGEDTDTVMLPLPTVTSNFYTDFYILPKVGFDAFCHYAGVAGAANLFVEIMAPTLLFAVCERVLTAAQLGLDFSGFAQPRTLRWFENPRSIAVHPVKLSEFRRPSDQEALVTAIRTIGDTGRMPERSDVSHVGFGRPMRGFIGEASGWHQAEDWGVWSSAFEAVITIPLPAPGAVSVTLRRPVFDVALGVEAPEMIGRLLYNGARHIDLAIAGNDSDVTVVIERLEPEDDGVGRIRLISGRLVCPRDVNPAFNDSRRLGLGLVAVERLAA